ncbi:MAG TPA: ATP-binding protein [Acidimicrobiales bacterium]|nr:ATP-binding protein [Acidimicrobiales bacterium]
MRATSAQLQFAAELAAFLAAVALLALLAVRSELVTRTRWVQAVLSSGAAALATAAFLRGAAISGPWASSAAGAARLAAGTLLVLPLVARRRTSGGGWLAVAGAAVAAAGALRLVGASQPAEEALMAAAAVTVGVVLAGASRRAIAAQISLAATAALLVTVLVVSIALSSVLAGTVRNDALSRLDGQAAAQAVALPAAAEASVRDAKVVLASVEGSAAVASAPAGAPRAAAVQAVLDADSGQFFADVGLLWVAADGTVLAGAANFDRLVGHGDAATATRAATAIVTSPLVAAARGTGAPQYAIEVAAGVPVAVGAWPGPLGAAVAVSTLAGTDPVRPRLSATLKDAARGDPSLSLALTDGSHVLAAFPDAALVQSPQVLSAARSVLRGAAGAAPSAGPQLTVIRPVDGFGGRPVMALVAQTPGSAVDRTRASLFHTLFVVALGASLLAFLLALFASERITRGIDVLTRAARRLGRGDTRVRTGIAGADELGVLSGAFDRMASSIEEQAAALRGAAEEEAALRSRLQSVIAGMGEALIACEADGTVTELNAAATRLLRRDRADALGRPVEEVAPTPAGQPSLSALADGGITGAETTIAVAGGEPVAVAVTVGRLSSGGDEPPGWVAVLRDLRAEREVERMKSQFLSRIGHELRTPLTGIIGFASLLSRREVPADQARGFNDEILSQARRLERVVRLLEIVAAAGANRLEVQVEAVDVGRLLTAAAARWTERLGGEPRLEVNLPPGLSAVAGDARWIDIAVDEMLDNALKFSAPGSPVRLTAASHQGTVDIAIADSGPGMSSEEIEAAFADFEQGDASDTRSAGGLGLGLAVVKRVAAAHGGEVRCESVPGTGSTFVLRLPASPRRRGSDNTGMALRGQA